MIISFPKNVMVEKSVKGKAAGMLSQMRLGDSCAILCDPDVQKIIGNDVRKDLSSSFTADIISPESLEKKHLEKLAKQLGDYDFLIGMGGGRAMDITKYSAHLADTEWVAFPTILSQDGIVSSNAVISDGGRKTSVWCKEPAAIIADINTIKRAPYRFIAAGAGDLLSNISAVEDWRIAGEAGKENYNPVTARLSLLAAEAVMENPEKIRNKDAGGLEILFWSLMLSGFSKNMHGSSRPTSGSEHYFAHALEQLGSRALHGEQAALGALVSVFLQKGDWLKIKAVMEKLGLPATAKDAGMERDMVIEALMLAPKIRDRYTVLDKYDITRKQAENILQKVGII
ncbi:MAG: iron-containing alcohol dehydrogenase [Candidatus Aenigmarchaeota archaeon]|nr:iron-containing alcohol dehydrogenase [Candidatus Aenigmarchaeota archaeon]